MNKVIRVRLSSEAEEVYKYLNEQAYRKIFDRCNFKVLNPINFLIRKIYK